MARVSRLVEGLARLLAGRFSVIAVLAILISAASPALADVFTISHVKVDVTSQNAAQAKVEALEQAQLKAFRRLVERLAPPGSEGLLPEFSGSDAARMMASMTVEDERTGPKRYIATFTISFLPDYVRNVFYQYNVPFTEQQAPAVLFLPVWNGPQGPVLWEGENPWRDAWVTGDLENSLTPMLVPLGDITDISTISAAEAVNGDPVKLEALGLRYGVSNVLVTVAEPSGENAISVRMRGETGFGYLDAVRSFESSGETVEDRAVDAAVRLQQLLEQAWKTQAASTTPPAAALNSITVAIPFDSLQEWNAIRTRISQTHGVGAVDIDSLSARGGIVRVSYDGTLQQLTEELRFNGLLLSEVGGTWVIQPQY
jgi:hypothetical protein